MSNSNEKFNVDGNEHPTLKTTAAEPQVEPSTERNAGGAKTVAQQAAADAKTIGEEYTGESKISATDKLQRDASKTTNAAVSEGKKDVDHIKAVGDGYVEQVKAFAQTAIETAQTYLPTSIASKLPNLSEATTPTTSAESRSSSNDIPATSAPLESGPHTVNYPYSSETNVGANEETPRIHS